MPELELSSLPVPYMHQSLFCSMLLSIMTTLSSTFIIFLLLSSSFSLHYSRAYFHPCTSYTCIPISIFFILVCFLYLSPMEHPTFPTSFSQLLPLSKLILCLSPFTCPAVSRMSITATSSSTIVWCLYAASKVGSYSQMNRPVRKRTTNAKDAYPNLHSNHV